MQEGNLRRPAQSPRLMDDRRAVALASRLNPAVDPLRKAQIPGQTPRSRRPLGHSV
jgi:hypothetical protein